MIFDCTGTQNETILRLAVCDPSVRVLDVGCGDGQKTACIARHARFVFGVDPDENCVRTAESRHAEDNLRFQAAGAESLCFADASFDSVLLNESLHHVPADRQSQALRECLRVLRTGGRLLILEPVHGSGSSGRILKIFNHEKACRQSAIDAIEGANASGFELVSKTQIRAAFSCHGFDDLYAYYTMSEPDQRWGEKDRLRLKNRLESCPRDSQGDYLIDYRDYVWLLIKK